MHDRGVIAGQQFVYLYESGTRFGNFSGRTQILKLNAKEWYYSSKLHFVLLPDGYIERLQDENTEKKKEPHMT